MHVGMQAEQATLEQKNHELIKAFGEKSKAQQQQQKLYQALKAQVMASHVANAAGDEADFTLHTARADKFVDRLPGTRTGTANYNQPGAPIRQGRQRYGRREGSGSSGSGGQPQGGGVGLGPTYNPQLHGHGLNARGYTGRRSLMKLVSKNILTKWFRIRPGRNGHAAWATSKQTPCPRRHTFECISQC